MNLGPTLQRLLDLSNSPASWSTSGFYLVDFPGDTCLTSQLLMDLGRSSADWADERFSDSFHPEDQTRFRDQWRRIFEGPDDTFHFEGRIRDPRNQGWCWVQSHGLVLQRLNGRVAAFAGLDQNVTEPRTAEAIIRQQFVDLERVFQQSETLRVASRLTQSTDDLATTLPMVLDHCRNLIPFDRAAVTRLVGGELRELCTAGEDPGAVDRSSQHPVWAVIETNTPELREDLGPDEPYRSWMGIPLVMKERTLGVLEFWRRDAGAFGADHVWPAMGFADSLADTLSHSQVYEGLREEIQTDPLTGLLSRRHLEAVGPMVIEACIRDRQPFAVLLLDIDRFKQINDGHGHMVGDAVLMSIAQLCRSLLRHGDLFFRYGGEEFVALLPNTEAEVAIRVAQRLREITASARFRGIENEVTASIGVASVPAGHPVGFLDALQEADRAMYRAKTAGRNGVVLSDRWER